MEGDRLHPHVGPRARPSGPRLRAIGIAFAALLVASLVPFGGAGASPVRPQAVSVADSILDPVPWASPAGEHLITFRRSAAGGKLVLGARSRLGGGRFRPFDAFSQAAGAVGPDIVFGPGSSALAVWDVSGAPEVGQSVRNAGRSFGPPFTGSPCTGMPSIAGSGAGGVVTACEVEGVGPTPFSGWTGASTLPARVAPDVQVTSGSAFPLRSTATARGSDGTSVAVFELPGGDPGTVSIIARVSGPGGSFTEIEEVTSFPDPGEATLGGAAVLPNGTVAVAGATDAGAALFVRPPGAGASFLPNQVPEDLATMPRADSFGRVHFLVVDDPGGPGASYSARVREPGGSIGGPIPIPTRGASPEPVEEGFLVRPDGQEFLITKSATGFFLSYRKPGAGAYSLPSKLASRPAGTRFGAASLTPRGDILVTWTERAAGGQRRLLLGGWDRGSRPEISRITSPRRVVAGRAARFAVRASDSMGLLRVVWRFSDGSSARGERVRVRFADPGRVAVRLTVEDRAGNRTIRFRTLTVVRSARG